MQIFNRPIGKGFRAIGAEFTSSGTNLDAQVAVGRALGGRLDLAVALEPGRPGNQVVGLDGWHGVSVCHTLEACKQGLARGGGD